MEGIKKIKSLGILLGIILIVLGAVFIIYNRDVVTALAIIVGICISAIGIGKLLQAKFSKNEDKHKLIHVVLGVILIALGIFIFIDIKASVMVVGLSIGAFAFISAFDRFATAIHRKKKELPCKHAVIFGLVHVGFGLLMIYFSFTMLTMIVTLAGIYLITAGLMVILSVAFYSDYQ